MTNQVIPKTLLRCSLFFFDEKACTVGTTETAAVVDVGVKINDVVCVPDSGNCELEFVAAPARSSLNLSMRWR